MALHPHRAAPVTDTEKRVLTTLRTGARVRTPDGVRPLLQRVKIATASAAFADSSGLAHGVWVTVPEQANVSPVSVFVHVPENVVPGCNVPGGPCGPCGPTGPGSP